MKRIARAVVLAAERRTKPKPVLTRKKSPARSEASKQKMRERGARSRACDLHGEAAYQAKLTVAKVRDILRSSESNAALARKHVVSDAAIWLVRAGRTWARVFIEEQRRKQCQPPQ